MTSPGKIFVHAKALCEAADIGEGTRIWAFAHVMPGAIVGRRCNLGEQVYVETGAIIGNGVTVKNGVSVWNGVVLEDHVFVGPNAVFTNVTRPRAFIKRGIDQFSPTRVKRGATLGANATLVCGVTVGEFAFVGAGAVVREAIPAHALVVGNPGRIVGRVCYCGQRLDFRDFCLVCSLPLIENSFEKLGGIHAKAHQDSPAGVRVLGAESPS